MLIALIVVIVIIIVVIAIVIGMYNNLVKSRNRVDNAWQQIEVQLQRRSDLVPNLVETVKGYAIHESKTLDNVTRARASLNSATSPDAKMQADNQLTGALKSLFAVSEAYPDLKANSNFQQLQAQLSETEDKISYMRQSFNDTVMKYNNAIQTFPAALFAPMLGFKPREGFVAEAAAVDVPHVSFDDVNGR